MSLSTRRAVHVFAKTRSVIPRICGPLDTSHSIASQSVASDSITSTAPIDDFAKDEIFDFEPVLLHHRDTVHSSRCSDIHGLIQLYDLKPHDAADRSKESAQADAGTKSHFPPAAVTRKDTTLRGLCKRVCSDPRFELYFAVLVVINVLITSLEVDYHDALPSMFGVLNVIFAVIFTIEVCVRTYASPHFDTLLLFDILIVAVTVFEIILLDRINRQMDTNFNLSYLLALRIFRLVRVLRIARFLQSIEVLAILTEAICSSAQPLFHVLVLLVLMLFAFSLVLTSLLPFLGGDHGGTHALRYGSVWTSFVALLEATVGVDEWGAEVAWPLFVAVREGDASAWSALFILAVFLAILTTRLGVSGLLMGVFLDQLLTASEHRYHSDWEGALAEHDRLLQELDDLLMSLGYTAGEQISWTDLVEAFKQRPEVLPNLGASVDVAERLFRHLDADGDNHVLVDEFLFAIFKLRTITKSVDMLSIDYQQEKTLRRISELQANLRLALANVQARLSPLLRTLLGLRTRVTQLRADLHRLVQLRASLMSSLKRRVESLSEARSPAMLAVEYRLGRGVTSLEDLARRSPGPAHVSVADISATVVGKLHELLEREFETFDNEAAI